MTTAYVVTSGDYSDYSVDLVFLDKAKAEAFVERMGGDEYSRYRIEEYEVTEDGPEVRDRLSIVCSVMEDGTITDTWYHMTAGEERLTPEWGRSDWCACESYAYVHLAFASDNPDVVEVSAHGFDHDRVRKRYSELVAQTRAEAHILIAAERERRAEDERQYRLKGEPMRGRVYGSEYLRTDTNGQPSSPTPPCPPST